MTLLQLIITHFFLLVLASLTRGLAGPLRGLGLGAAVAPTTANNVEVGRRGFRGGQPKRSQALRLVQYVLSGYHGVAGTGLVTLEWKTVRQVLPLAGVFTTKLVLSNLSFAYTVMPMYMLARIAIVPLSLLFTAFISRTSHSVQTLSSTLTATLNLLMASIRPGRVTWESILAGVSSTLFVALFPILLQRTYHGMVQDGPTQTESTATTQTSDEDDPAQLPTTTTANAIPTPETRAYWTLLHTLSLLAILILTPLVLASGELPQIKRNCYFLDVPFFWVLMFSGGIGSVFVFTGSLLLVEVTSPLSVTFVSVPRSAFQLVVLSKFRLPAQSWVGVGICWASCLWYVLVRRREEQGRELREMQGR
ncbi:hypothetical protein LTR66_001186 [Elasticomyces elasticus]|nr:hypothetical protein LTR66_001186 [Elasticomyces elasticus]